MNNKPLAKGIELWMQALHVSVEQMSDCWNSLREKVKGLSLVATLVCSCFKVYTGGTFHQSLKTTMLSCL